MDAAATGPQRSGNRMATKDTSGGYTPDASNHASASRMTGASALRGVVRETTQDPAVPVFGGRTEDHSR
jgi:hypothetical protein